MKTKIINIIKNGTAVFLIAGLSVFTSCNSDNNDIAQDEGDDTYTSGSDQKATDQYMVIFKSGSSATTGQMAAPSGGGSPLQNEANRILKEKGAQEITVAPIANFSGMINGFVAQLTPDQVDALKNDPKVLRVEQDQGFVIGKPSKTTTTRKGKPTKTTTTTTTTTTSTSTSTTTTSSGGSSTNCITNAGSTQPAQQIPWGVKAIGGHLSAVGKTAWILDTGIDFNHPDLNVDKTRSRSFIYSYQSATYYQSACDEMGHGTWVAGILGAKDNSIGVVGVAAGATLVSVRVMDKTGYGYVSSVVNGINYVAANAKPGDVANFSISFGASATMDDAIRNLAAKGVYVVIGSGNSATDCATCSPARVDAPNVYTISGMDINSIWVSTSNYGKAVDYCAPGKDVYTTSLNGTYRNVTGTSFAAPHAAGVLLATGGQPKHFAYVQCDPDPYTDPIIHRHPHP